MLFNVCKEEETQKQTPLSLAFEVEAAANYEEAGTKAFFAPSSVISSWITAVHPP
jgi:hypothetical protein